MLLLGHQRVHLAYLSVRVDAQKAHHDVTVLHRQLKIGTVELLRLA